ncbi:MAG: hypothetical protein ABJ215_12710 [Alphaproteobacteria bacterium]
MKKFAFILSALGFLPALWLLSEGPVYAALWRFCSIDAGDTVFQSVELERRYLYGERCRPFCLSQFAEGYRALEVDVGIIMSFYLDDKAGLYQFTVVERLSTPAGSCDLYDQWTKSGNAWATEIKIIESFEDNDLCIATRPISQPEFPHLAINFEESSDFFAGINIRKLHSFYSLRPNQVTLAERVQYFASPGWLMAAFATNSSGINCADLNGAKYGSLANRVVSAVSAIE